MEKFCERLTLLQIYFLIIFIISGVSSEEYLYDEADLSDKTGPTLRVRRDASAQILPAKTNMAARLGSELKMTCKNDKNERVWIAYGNSTDRLMTATLNLDSRKSWSMDRPKTNIQSRNLSIQGVSQSDAGYFGCRISEDSSGNSVSMHIGSLVVFDSKLFCEGSAEVGQDIECSVNYTSYNLKPKLIWEYTNNIDAPSVNLSGKIEEKELQENYYRIALKVKVPASYVDNPESSLKCRLYFESVNPVTNVDNGRNNSMAKDAPTYTDECEPKRSPIQQPPVSQGMPFTAVLIVALVVVVALIVVIISCLCVWTISRRNNTYATIGSISEGKSTQGSKKSTKGIDEQINSDYQDLSTCTEMKTLDPLDPQYHYPNMETEIINNSGNRAVGETAVKSVMAERTENEYESPNAECPNEYESPDHLSSPDLPPRGPKAPSEIGQDPRTENKNDEGDCESGYSDIPGSSENSNYQPRQPTNVAIEVRQPNDYQRLNQPAPASDTLRDDGYMVAGNIRPEQPI